jgi:hypothetical protein
MRDSVVVLAMNNFNGFSAVLWDTEVGKVLVTQGTLSINSDISIRGMNGEDLDSIDLRNFLMSIIPREI